MGACRFAFGGWRAWSSAAAIVREIAKQGVHRFELSRVDHGAAIAADGDEASRPQSIKMERQRVRCEVESGCNRTGWHALGSGFHQQAEDIKAIVLGERRQRCDDISFFHISTIIEIKRRRQ
jgi:hypothetical protein